MQIGMCLAQHALHAIPVIHTVMVAVSAMHIAMLPRQAPVPNWHAAPHRAVHRQRVAHVHRAHVTGVITSLQPTHRAHQRIALNQLHL